MFVRKNEIDTGANRDTQKQAIVELDEDVTRAFFALNMIESDVALKEDVAKIDVAGGLCKLNDSNLIDLDNLPKITHDNVAKEVRAPIGSLLMWPMEALPAKYLLCDGSVLSASYPELVAILSTDNNPYGSSGGYPRIPDYRGYFIRGYGGGLNTITLSDSTVRYIDPDYATRYDRGDGKGGDVVGSWQPGSVANHTHNTFDWYWKSDTPNSFVVYDPGAGFGTEYASYTDSYGDTETRPKNKSMKVLIKYEY